MINKVVALLIVIALAQVYADLTADYRREQRAQLSSNFADFCKVASDKIINDVKALKEDDDSNLFGDMLIQAEWDDQFDGANFEKYQTEESQRDALVHSCNRIKSYFADVSQMFEKAKKSLIFLAVPAGRARLGHFDCAIVERLRNGQEWCDTSLQATLEGLKQVHINWNQRAR